MFSRFDYSREMQIILILFIFIYNILLMYIKSNFLFEICEKKVPINKSILYTFICGSIIFCTDIYKLIIACGIISADDINLFILAIPAILVTIIYCYFCIKHFGLALIWASEISIYVYVYIQAINSTIRLIDTLLFHYDIAQFNYLLYMAMYAINFIINLIIYKIIWYVIKNKPQFIIPKKNIYIYKSKGFAFSIFQLCFIYLCVAIIPKIIPNTVIGNLFVFIVLSLFLAFTIALYINKHSKADIYDKENYIKSLSSSLDEFRAIKHDFYNILQTYNGYLEIGDIDAFKKYHASLVNMTKHAGDCLDLSTHINENPALVSLLLNKKSYAERVSVDTNFFIGCSLLDLPIDKLDLCRILSCLLDNAIEAAIETQTKILSFSINKTKSGSYLIIITNSTSTPLDKTKMFSPGMSTKAGHQGIGLNTVLKIIEKYPNCAFHMNYSDNQMATYVELTNYLPITNIKLNEY